MEDEHKVYLHNREDRMSNPHDHLLRESKFFWHFIEIKTSYKNDLIFNPNSQKQ